MMSDPLTQSPAAASRMYEYGEYDGLVDLDAVLHGTTNAPANTTATVTGSAAAASPTPNVSCRVGSDDNSTYAHYLSLQGHSNNNHHNNNNNSGELGPTPSPHGRSPARKPTRDTATRGSVTASVDRYPGMHGSNSSVPRSNGGYPMTMEEGDVTVSTAPTMTAVNVPAATAALPGSRGGQRKRGDSANGSRNHAGGGVPSQGTDSNVHLPVILPSQQRRPTETMLPSRVRVSPLTQDHTHIAGSAATTGVPTTTTNTAGSSSATSTPLNARSATSVSPMAQHARPAPAKTVMSASNLAALQRSGNERAHTGALSTGNSSNKVPPYLAPPLTPLHTRANQPVSHATSTNTNTNNAAAVAKRGDSSETAPHGAGVVEPTSPTRRSNGWVREEARRIDHTSQELAGGFPQERVRHSGSSSVATNTTGTENAVNLGPDGAATATAAAAAAGNGRGKVNTSPAPTAPRAPVWTNDYEMGRGDLVGCTSTLTTATTTDFGAMPRVAAPPLPQRSKKTLSDSSKKLPPFRPPPHLPSTPPVGTRTSPVESVISPLRTVAQRAARQSNAAAVAAAAGEKAMAHPPPLTGQTTNTNTASPSSSPSTAAAAAHQGHGVGRPVSAAADGSSGPHTPSNTHRRVMNAVDTHAAVPADLSDEQKAVAVVVALNSAKKQTGAKAQLPYSEDRRAALEAWAAFPALDVTIRNQTPSATQARRERDLAAARPAVAHQLYQAVKGQAPQEFAGEPFEMNYDVHNVVVQLRHRNRPLVLAYPAQLPLEMDTRPRLRRQRTPRSFYGKRFAHVGDVWFRNALDDARHIDSPDIESMEKREEEEFVRNGGDLAHRRNRYGQANNNNNNQNQQRPQQQPHAATGAPDIEHINRNAVRLEQPAV